jgi:hypothetical protein
VLLPWKFGMAATAKTKRAAASSEWAATLAPRLSEALLSERIVPRFVDSYVVEHSRHSLQVHAGLYKDLLALLQREALVTISARALEIATGSAPVAETKASGAATAKSKRAKASTKPPLSGRTALLPPMSRKEAAAFRQKFLAALTRQQKWNVSDALAFQTDLRMYEDIIARSGAPRRPRKPFEAANHPFVDRCAFVLDSSFLEIARMAASRALNDLELLAVRIVDEVRAPVSLD